MKEYAGDGGRRAKRAKRKTYVDGMSSSDEESDVLENGLDPEDLYKQKVYPPFFVKEMLGEDVSVEYFQKTGFKNPIFVRQMNGLNMKIPDTSFSITDVRNLVGSKRVLEVMNTATQSNAEMTLKDWEEWWTAPDRDETKLNVISLEFSGTKLDRDVIAPRVVRQVDFVDNVWPRHLKDMQEDTTNDMSTMRYPKVQKYCLMSIAGCYTDFHVDLGGTSVWYHVLRGQKIFWLIPPTAQNLKAFELWHIEGKQQQVFFGDLVQKCGRVELNPGNTFLIPSGWIHAVYTPKDSLVFGGNFLHPYAIERQLKIAQLEETLKVPHKYRFPFFTEMMWWVLDRYCYHLLGRHHMTLEGSILTRLIGTEEERKAFQEKIGHPYLTPEEVRGLKSIVLYLHNLPANKKNPPSFLKDPVSLIKDIRIIVEVHKTDTFGKSLTGKPILYWPGIRNDPAMFRSKSTPRSGIPVLARVEVKGKLCLDRRSVCCLCGLDGWWSDTQHEKVDRAELASVLRECVLCHAVVHPDCLHDVGVDGVLDPATSGLNWWTCPHCVLCPPAPEPEVKPAEVPLQTAADSIVKQEPVEAMDTSESPETEAHRPSKMMSRVADLMAKISASNPGVRAATQVYSGSSEFCQQDLIMGSILSLLTTPEQEAAKLVCKEWKEIISKLHTTSNSLDLSAFSVSASLLPNIVKSPLVSLNLSGTSVNKQQLSWILQRLPSLQHLSLCSLDWSATVSALAVAPSSGLTSLHLDSVTSLNDAAVSQLLRHRDDQKKCCLASLRVLSLSRTAVSDISLRYVAQNLSSLRQLRLRGCDKITEAGLTQLGDPQLHLHNTLQHLDIRDCPLIKALMPLSSCTSLINLNIQNSGVGKEATDEFLAANSKYKLVHNHVLRIIV